MIIITNNDDADNGIDNNDNEMDGNNGLSTTPQDGSALLSYTI